MSRKDDSSLAMLALLLAPIALLLYPIVWLLNLIVENIGIFLIIVAIVIVIVVIVVLIASAVDKKQKEEEAERQRIEAEQRRQAEEQRRKDEERKHNLKIISEIEPRPSLLPVPEITTSSCAEEAAVNQKFREFLNQKNEKITQDSHADFLVRKANAFRALNRSEEADFLRDSIREAQAAAIKANSVIISYKSENNELMYRSQEIKNAYSSFVGVLGNRKVAVIDEFIQSPMVKAVKVDNTTSLLFTPGYVLCYRSSKQVFDVVPYKKVKISIDITSELREGGWNSGDEIERIRYRYETRDGSRDMRYSYENNPSYTYVYRGTATVKCGDVVFEKKFRNKSSTEAFQRDFQAYIALIEGKYSKVVEQVLGSKKALVDAGSVEAFLAQETEKAEKRKAAEDARREREDRERRLAAEQRERERKYSEERNILLAKVKLLRVKSSPCWQYFPGGAMIEERLLNELYLEFDAAKRDAARIEECNRFIKKHKDRFEVLNYYLKLPMDADIAEWQSIVAAEEIPEALPERFVKLNSHFSKSKFWKDFVRNSAAVAREKMPDEVLGDLFFSGVDCFSVERQGVFLYFFPYCSVLFHAKKPMKVFGYRNATAKVSYREEDLVINAPPAFAELVGQRYKYQNADGSPDRRYKENPIVKTVRYTTVTVNFDREQYSFPVKKYRHAETFAEGFNGLAESVSGGEYQKIYGLVLSSAETNEIDDAFLTREKEEKERRKQERLRQQEELRRAEEERLAHQLAEEAKRKAIIERQKALNEERRRKLAEEEERKKRVESMFRDDFEKDSSSGKEPSVKIKTSEIEGPFEVIGKRMISNSVFKVTLRCLDSVPLGTVTASFVSLCGERISNLKQIALQAGEDVTLGFVLNPGRDFTEMKGCYLRLESEGAVVGDFLFEMNISFSNDF